MTLQALMGCDHMQCQINILSTKLYHKAILNSCFLSYRIWCRHAGGWGSPLVVMTFDLFLFSPLLLATILTLRVKCLGGWPWLHLHLHSFIRTVDANRFIACHLASCSHTQLTQIPGANWPLLKKLHRRMIDQTKLMVIQFSNFLSPQFVCGI